MKKVFGYKEVSNLNVKQLLILVKNVQNVVKEERDFWITAYGDDVYLCWGKEVV